MLLQSWYDTPALEPIGYAPDELEADDLSRQFRQEVLVMEWPLQEAKNRFSEVVSRACDNKEGPQIVTRRGKRTAVVMAYEDYIKLRAPKESLIEFFQSSPLRGLELDLERDRSLSRLQFSGCGRANRGHRG